MDFMLNVKGQQAEISSHSVIFEKLTFRFVLYFVL